MKALILQDCEASRDGINVERFTAGQVVEMPATLVRSLETIGWVQEHQDMPEIPVVVVTENRALSVPEKKPLILTEPAPAPARKPAARRRGFHAE